MHEVRRRVSVQARLQPSGLHHGNESTTSRLGFRGPVSELLLWCVYVGALEGRKLRRFEHITKTTRWKTHLNDLRYQLWNIGLVL